METTQLLAALDRDSRAFASACEAAQLSSPVGSCPGWSVADLFWHLTEVQDFWNTIVAEQRSDWTGYTQPPRPADEDLAALYATGRDRLLQTLGAVDPAAPVWTWSKDKTAGFVIRRMAQETAVHLWDAQDASAAPQPIEANLASDGIDEFLSHMLPDTAKDAERVGGSVHLHCTDVAGEWLVKPGDDGLVVTREHAKGDCAIRGGASDLLLALWRRIPLSSCDVVGDADLAARFVARTALD